MTIDYCNSKIDHIERVLTRIVALTGQSTGLYIKITCLIN